MTSRINSDTGTRSGGPVDTREEEKLSYLRKEGRLKIRITSGSDKDDDKKRRLMWGDYWVKHELAKEFKRMGLSVVDRDPHVLLHLFGSPATDISKNTYNTVWLYSHPDRVTPENLRNFDRIFCASSSYTLKLKAMGYQKVDTMIACTSKMPLNVPVKHDIVFVGNARTRRPEGRSVVGHMGLTHHDFKVWGNLWETILPGRYYGGKYWAYEELEKLYASALINLNDHHKDMAREGFVSNKIFDILAGGGFVISQRNTGITPVFGDSVPQYDSPDQLKDLVEFYLTNPGERERLMLKGRGISLIHTYRKRAEQIINTIIAQPLPPG